jgi:hypothetical protein
MTDEEMLKLAAKAAGYEWLESIDSGEGGIKVAADPVSHISFGWEIWDPLNEDGDALRLAVYLKMTIKVGDNAVDVSYVPGDGSVACFTEYFAEGIETAEAATRRAITGLAANIGRGAQ